MGFYFLLFLLAGLICSRTAVLIHEYVGHGLWVVLLGGQITDTFFYYFGTARIAYHFDHLGSVSAAWLMLSGVCSNLTMGAWLLSKVWKGGRSLHFFLFCLGGFTLTVEQLYAVRSLHYGFGDGAWFYSRWELSIREIGVFVLSCIFLIWFCFFTAQMTHILKVWGQGCALVSHWRTVCLAALLAVAVHIGLFALEVRFFPDPGLEEVFFHQLENDVALRLAQEVDDPSSLTEVELNKVRDEIRGRLELFPLDALLFPLMAVCGGVSFWRGLSRGPAVVFSRPTRKDFAAGAGFLGVLMVLITLARKL